MIPVMTEVEKAKVENLKNFPELILEIKRSRMACCHRCGGFINLDHYCLMSMTHSYSDPQSLRPFGCPHCGNMVIDNVGHKYTSRQPIPHSIVEIIEYCVERKEIRSMFFRKKVVETWIKEWRELKLVRN